MAANKPTTPQKTGASIPPAAFVIALVLVLGAASLLYLNRAAQRPPEPPAALSGDARTYVRNGFLPIRDVDMQAHESYLKQQIVEITGKIGNTGNRVVSNAQIYCVFRDAYGQVVLRERVAIVKQKVSPGDMQSFRLAFDNVPASWNQALPDIVIASIDFTGA